jgi:HlyD family secretion protein
MLISATATLLSDWAEYTRRLYKKGFVNSNQLESADVAAERSKLELDLLQTQLDVLDRYTKPKKVEELTGEFKAKQAKLASDQAALKLEKDRLDREEEQLTRCTITAESAGMVIYPTTEQWKNQPNIEEGATVREDQVLLIIPDLQKMQVKLGIHEAYVDRIRPGMTANVKLQDEVLDGKVESIATVTRPAGWWNGNQVKYDTVVKLDSADRLKPGMSASVEVFLARHADVLTIPVAAVVEQDGQHFCWVSTSETLERRRLDLGDSNDQFIVVNGGVSESEEVVLNPRASVKAAQVDALRPVAGISASEPAASVPSD